MRTIRLHIAIAMSLSAFLCVAVPTNAAQRPSLITKRELTVYESPRRGLFCQPGKNLGTLARGAMVEGYTEVTVYCGPLYAIEYIHFTYKTSEGNLVAAYISRRENSGEDKFEMRKEQ